MSLLEEVVKIIVTFEGRMGCGKTTACTAFAYIEYVKREILRSAIDFVLKDTSWDEALNSLQEEYKISKKVASATLQEALEIFEREGEEAYRDSIKIISSNHLNFPYTHFDSQFLIDHMEDEEIEDCILILDEAFQVMDSRGTASKINKLFTYFVAQTRKRGVEMYVCTHHIDEVDKRLRRKPDVRGTCRFNKGPLEEHLPIFKRSYNWVTIRFRDLRNGNGRRVRIYGPAFWHLFETRERLPLQRRQLEIEL